MNLRRLLQHRLESALRGLAADGDVATLSEMLVPAGDAKFGDYQINCAMPLAKLLKRPPRDVAQELIPRLKVDDVCEPIGPPAGPGFINLRLKNDWLTSHARAALADERLGIVPVAVPRTVIVDYSAPNVAKPMHVGHIRSTVIGDAVYRSLKFLGHNAIGDNHLGDWGTQFGMIIYGYRNLLDAAAYKKNPLDELARLYRTVNQQADADPQIRTAALTETAKLHAGDEENLRLWREFMPVAIEAIEVVYRRLGVTFDETLGESFYHDQLADVVADLEAKGLATTSDGALCVFLEGQETPMLIRKKDGAFLYATTDLATIGYRMTRWKPDAVLYVVDHRQSLHFEQLFAAAKLWGYADCDFRHLSFGTVLGKDGKPYKTRSGDTIGLMGLLDEAVAEALKIVSENDDGKPDGPELDETARRNVAEVVGIGGIKYADLSQNRTSDYEFSYEKMLAKNGNTATYMQYAYARVRSIFRRGGVDADGLRKSGAKIDLGTPAERALALGLLRFEEAIELSLVDFRPNLLTTYLFDVANAYSTFFEQCPVLKAPTPELRDSRLLLCDLTARTIKLGLSLLGIDVVEQM